MNSLDKADEALKKALRDHKAAVAKAAPARRDEHPSEYVGEGTGYRALDPAFSTEAWFAPVQSLELLVRDHIESSEGLNNSIMIRICHLSAQVAFLKKAALWACYGVVTGTLGVAAYLFF